jgi:hypothetical protein
MKRIAFLLAIISIVLTSIDAQQVNDNIDHIAFRFSHSRRIPNSFVEIELIKRKSETTVYVNSTPMNNDKQWERTRIDTSFMIENTIFEELTNQVLLLTKIDLNRALFLGAGLDGTASTIEFGKYGATVAYKFWDPDYLTDKRGLSVFFDLCKKIIKIGGLDPQEIF